MRKEDTVCSLFGTVHLAQIHWVPLLAVIDIIMIAHLGLNVYDVTISEKPFGIQVTTSGTATVVSVLPESPAAGTCVRKGHILLAINGTVVDAESWKAEFNKAKLPFVVRFRYSSGIHQCILCGIARQFINIAKGPGITPFLLDSCAFPGPDLMDPPHSHFVASCLV